MTGDPRRKVSSVCRTLEQNNGVRVSQLLHSLGWGTDPTPQRAAGGTCQAASEAGLLRQLSDCTTCSSQRTPSRGRGPCWGVSTC